MRYFSIYKIFTLSEYDDKISNIKSYIFIVRLLWFAFYILCMTLAYNYTGINGFLYFMFILALLFIMMAAFCNLQLQSCLTELKNQTIPLLKKSKEHDVDYCSILLNDLKCNDTIKKYITDVTDVRYLVYGDYLLIQDIKKDDSVNLIYAKFTESCVKLHTI